MGKAAPTLPVKASEPRQEPRQEERQAVGEVVLYFDSQQSRWIKDVVKSVILSGKGVAVAYDLNCKKGAKPAEVRRISSGSAGTASAAAPEAAFAAGDKVRYWSATNNKWVPAKVQEVHRVEGGGRVLAYDLNLKPRAEPALVKPYNTSADAPPPQQGAAPPAAPPVSAGSGDAARLTAEYEVGKMVQYWSKKEERWFDCEVKVKKEHEGKIFYDLQCKKFAVQGATAERLRKQVI